MSGGCRIRAGVRIAVAHSTAAVVVVVEHNPGCTGDRLGRQQASWEQREKAARGCCCGCGGAWASSVATLRRSKGRTCEKLGSRATVGVTGAGSGGSGKEMPGWQTILAKRRGWCIVKSKEPKQAVAKAKHTACEKAGHRTEQPWLEKVPRKARRSGKKQSTRAGR